MCACVAELDDRGVSVLAFLTNILLLWFFVGGVPLIRVRDA
jgi:hypothetical protein